MEKYISKILEEFDEQFTITSNANTLRKKRWVSVGWLQNVGGHYIDSSKRKHMVGSLHSADEIKSFLKQSFIKYLQGQCEEIKKIQGDPFDDSDEYLHGIAYCKKELLNKLQAQIKELEV